MRSFLYIHLESDFLSLKRQFEFKFMGLSPSGTSFILEIVIKLP